MTDENQKPTESPTPQAKQTAGQQPISNATEMKPADATAKLLRYGNITMDICEAAENIPASENLVRLTEVVKPDTENK